MFLPRRLLKKTLGSIECLSVFNQYCRKRRKLISAQLRGIFLQRCLNNQLIPRFLNFGIPENGCFEETIVRNFQRKLLRREMSQANIIVKRHEDELRTVREQIIRLCPQKANPLDLFVQPSGCMGTQKGNRKYT